MIYRLSFFDLELLINPLVSSNISYHCLDTLAFVLYIAHDDFFDNSFLLTMDLWN